MSFWSVIQVESKVLRLREGARTIVEQRLTRSGFESYLPRAKYRKRSKFISAPLFPGYIFVRVVDQWYPILWTEGVIRMLMAGEEPAHLSERVVKGIRELEGRDGFIRLPVGRFRKGAQVRILSGQFQGFIALYEGQTAKERERVLLELMGRVVPVELGTTDRIEAISLDMVASK